MSRRGWIITVVTIAVVIAAGYYFVTATETGRQIAAPLIGGGTSAGAPASQSGETLPEGTSTVQIQPAESMLGEVSASGNIQLVTLRSVIVEVDGSVNTVAVNPGDTVKTGDLLLTLTTVALERDARRAELGVETAKTQLEQLTEATSPADIAAAEADLAKALETLEETRQGPSAQEVAAARSALASAQAKYNELLDGPSEAELTQLSADLRKKEVALQKAQEDYDKIAWQTNSGMTSQAVTLQDATIDYESALAAFTEATASASTSELESARSSIQDAQVKLDDLLNSPTAADIASAEAAVAQAQASLTDIQTGPSDLDRRDVEITLEKAIVDLEEAYTDLSKAQVVSPLDGLVIDVTVDVGERVSKNTVVAYVADPTQLELTINVAEIDVVKLAAGQPAQIEIDAIPSRTFEGVVDYIAPSSDSSSGVVYYPVTIRLDPEALQGVLPGMTAVAVMQDSTAAAEDAWLVPSNAIRRGQGASGGDAAVVIVRGGVSQSVAVTPGSVQGEWTVVQSPELRAGDQVVGSLTSFVSDNNARFGPGGGGMPMGGPSPGGGR